jgi:acyl phosphate:glycerol-3-phosphate acyltransferase
LRILLSLSLLAYLIASVNFSIILFKILGKGDPRDRYSGNAGTTNVSRQLGKFWGFIILLLDMGRAGALAQFGGWFLSTPMIPWLGLALILGNQKPLFHRFRGGKGVASYLGFTALFSPVSAGISCLAWLAGYVLFQQPFLGSFFMVLVLGTGTMIQLSWDPGAVAAVVLTLAFIVCAHRSNIRSLEKKGALKE